MRLLYKIGVLLGIFTDIELMAENQLLVTAKINQLNLESTPEGQPVVNEWIAFQGYSAVTSASISATPIIPFQNATPVRMPTFNPMMGVVVKTFMNTRTGEIKLFNAYMFEYA